VPAGLDSLPDWQRAARFFITTQLAFAGMRRFNASGHFNVPFGHYKNFNDAALSSKPHVTLLKGAKILSGDYAEALKGEDNDRTFIFVDPPYTRVMKAYSSDSEFGDDAQRLLRDKLVALEKASWMVVIDKSDLTMELYGDYVVGEYDVSYGVNIRNRFDQGASHIVACNYKP
jgi:DNA adenine methylase